jgi:UTP--glucose-1-phosphate uridylyltransferase
MNTTVNESDLTWRDTESLLKQHLEKIRSDGSPPYVGENFATYFRRLSRQDTGTIGERDIEPVGEGALPRLDQLGEHLERGRAALGRCAMAKLNGGLGTSMGLRAAKSLLTVKSGLSFLDIIVGQVEHLRRINQVQLPLLFMNSFNTASDTEAALSVFEGNPAGIPLGFLQHRYPKILAESGAPARNPQHPHLEWNPPGHGEFYPALRASGTLAALLAAGIDFLFVSNADNLGATLSLEILGFLDRRDAPFLMEVTRRLESDRKGGHLAADRQGGLLLREVAQCRAEDLDAFQDIERHRYFNTNNLWVNLKALERQLAQSEAGALDLPMIRNVKHLDPTDPASPKVFQLESAMGSAISLFEGAAAVEVPRSRFLPVKTTGDLLRVRSDCYRLREDFHLENQRAADSGACTVELDPEFYGLLEPFEERFPDGAPSLRDCDRLQVVGDIRFGGDIRCRGEVRITNGSSTQARLDDHQTLEGDVRL